MFVDPLSCIFPLLSVSVPDFQAVLSDYLYGNQFDAAISFFLPSQTPRVRNTSSLFPLFFESVPYALDLEDATKDSLSVSQLRHYLSKIFPLSILQLRESSSTADDSSVDSSLTEDESGISVSPSSYIFFLIHSLLSSPTTISPLSLLHLDTFSPLSHLRLSHLPQSPSLPPTLPNSSTASPFVPANSPLVQPYPTGRSMRRDASTAVPSAGFKHAVAKAFPGIVAKKHVDSEHVTPTLQRQQPSGSRTMSRSQLNSERGTQKKLVPYIPPKDICPLNGPRSEIQEFVGEDVGLVLRSRFDTLISYGSSMTDPNVSLDVQIKTLFTTISASTLKQLAASFASTTNSLRFYMLRSFVTGEILSHSERILTLIDADPTLSFRFPSFFPDKLEPEKLITETSYFHRISSEWQQAQLKKNPPDSAIHLLVRHRLRPAYLQMLALLLRLFSSKTSKIPEISTQNLILFQNTVVINSVPTLRQLPPPAENEIVDPSSNKPAGMGLVLFLNEHRLLQTCLQHIRTSESNLQKFNERSNPQNRPEASESHEVSIPSTLRISTKSVQIEAQTNDTIQLMSNPARLLRSKSPKSSVKQNALITWIENRLNQLSDLIHHTISSTPSHLLFSLCLSPHPLVSNVSFDAAIHLFSLDFKTSIHPYRRSPNTALSFLFSAVNAQYDHVRANAQRLTSKIVSSSVWAFFYARSLLILDVDLKSMIQRTERRPQTDTVSSGQDRKSFHLPFGEPTERYVPHLAPTSLCSFHSSFIPPPQRFTTPFFSSKQTLSDEVKTLFEQVATKQKERRDAVIENMMSSEPDEVSAPASHKTFTTPLPQINTRTLGGDPNYRRNSTSTPNTFQPVLGRISPSHSSIRVDDENSSSSMPMSSIIPTRHGSVVTSSGHSPVRRDTLPNQLIPSLSTYQSMTTPPMLTEASFGDGDEVSALPSTQYNTSDTSSTLTGQMQNRSGRLDETRSVRVLKPQKDTNPHSIPRNTLQPEHLRREDDPRADRQHVSPTIDRSETHTPFASGSVDDLNPKRVQFLKLTDGSLDPRMETPPASSPKLDSQQTTNLIPTFPPSPLAYPLVSSSVPTTVSALPSSHFVCSLLEYPISQSRSSSDLQFLAGNEVFSVLVEIATANRIFSQDTSFVLQKLCRSAAKFNMIAVGTSFKVLKGKGGLFQTSRKKQNNPADQNSLFTSIIVEKDDLDRFLLLQDYIAFDETYENIFISLCSLMSSTAFFEVVRTNAPSLLNYIVDACFKDHPVLTKYAWKTVYWILTKHFLKWVDDRDFVRDFLIGEVFSKVLADKSMLVLRWASHYINKLVSGQFLSEVNLAAVEEFKTQKKKDKKNKEKKEKVETLPEISPPIPLKHKLKQEPFSEDTISALSRMFDALDLNFYKFFVYSNLRTILEDTQSRGSSIYPLVYSIWVNIKASPSFVHGVIMAHTVLKSS
ncbi:hypothetical protein BLNAU_8906 [Blattamonas nauphoetae]|uniref:Uncharacterized protein n=1 Tax=Blattamonas nauphoetae TaxID=2049346 RepID=A0ABQ9XXC4_9EUKA|nr:hypothetical protein BLNAU_8906 [Blattamonas nauphoetae]